MSIRPAGSIKFSVINNLSLNFFHLGINLLEKELHVQVLENHEHLVSQAMWVDRLENILADMQSNVQVNYLFEVIHNSILKLMRVKL